VLPSWRHFWRPIGQLRFKTETAWCMAGRNRAQSVVKFTQVPSFTECSPHASIGFVRKLVSILLMLVCGLQAAPLLEGLSRGDKFNLPACCRRNGQHHCMMSAAERSQLTGNDRAFRLPSEKCPYCPAAMTRAHSSSFTLPTSEAVFAALASHPAVFAQTQSRLRVSETRSRQKRGPPAVALS
jgi:hypothetical protein